MHKAELVTTRDGYKVKKKGETISVLNAIEIDVTAAQLLAMYATPLEILPAITGKAYIVDNVEFDVTRTATAFTGGGTVALQYKNTANGAGTAVHATIAATVLTGAAGRTVSHRIPTVQSDVAEADIVSQGLFLSNATQAFAAGTGTLRLIVHYHTI